MFSETMSFVPRLGPGPACLAFTRGLQKVSSIERPSVDSTFLCLRSQRFSRGRGSDDRLSLVATSDLEYRKSQAIEPLLTSANI